MDFIRGSPLKGSSEGGLKGSGLKIRCSALLARRSSRRHEAFVRRSSPFEGEVRACPSKGTGLKLEGRFASRTRPKYLLTTSQKPFWMEIPQPNFPSTFGQGGQPASTFPSPPPTSEQLAQPLTENERGQSWKQISSLHPGNRFRLMFGRSLLPESPESARSR